MPLGPFGVTADVHLVHRQAGAVSVDGEGRVNALAFHFEITAGVEIDSVTIAVAQRVVDEEGLAVHIGARGTQGFGELVVRHQQRLLARARVHFE